MANITQKVERPVDEAKYLRPYYIAIHLLQHDNKYQKIKRMPRTLNYYYE